MTVLLKLVRIVFCVLPPCGQNDRVNRPECIEERNNVLWNISTVGYSFIHIHVIISFTSPTVSVNSDWTIVDNTVLRVTKKFQATLGWLTEQFHNKYPCFTFLSGIISSKYHFETFWGRTSNCCNKTP